MYGSSKNASYDDGWCDDASPNEPLARYVSVDFPTSLASLCTIYVLCTYLGSAHEQQQHVRVEGLWLPPELPRGDCPVQTLLSWTWQTNHIL